METGVKLGNGVIRKLIKAASLIYDASWVVTNLVTEGPCLLKDSVTEADSRSALSSGSTCLPDLVCGPAPVWTL